jgi:hypothetical protein
MHTYTPYTPAHAPRDAPTHTLALAYTPICTYFVHLYTNTPPCAAQALDALVSRTDAVGQFDVALIGCGGLGMLLGDQGVL